MYCAICVQAVIEYVNGSGYRTDFLHSLTDFLVSHIKKKWARINIE